MTLKASILAWYDIHRRDLPWRVNREPYGIWVSEIMLQQTQVSTVLPYFEAFMDRFPDVDALAVAPVEEVLALWSGLGYYRRARYMHRAARQIVARGGFPETSRELRKLPGIGPYTAAAVASMAFGEVVPVLDGNVERLLGRRLALDQDPKTSSARKRLLEAGARLLDHARPGDSNQALMELGATVCRPKRPDCPRCPLRQGCLGRLDGDPERFPPPRRRRATEKVDLAVALVMEHERALLFKRPDGRELLAGMWELANIPRQAALAAMESELAHRYGGRWRLEPEIGLVKHGITHHALSLHVHPARFEAGESVAEGPEAMWMSLSEASRYPLSSMVEKVLKHAFAGRLGT